MNVLITSVGSNTSISVIKAIRKTFGNIIIVGTDVNPSHLCAGFSWVDHFIEMPGANDKNAYIEELEAIIREFNIDCVIPIHDLEIEVIAEVRDQFSNLSFIAVATWDVVNLCNDKKRANKAAAEVGLLIPNEYGISADKWNLPLIAKPLKGVSSSGIQILKSVDAVYAFLEQHNSAEFIIQEYIKGIEYTVDTYSLRSGKFYGGVVRKRIETKAGISTKGVTVNNSEILRLCAIYLEHIGYVGAANIQFIENENKKIYFVEINPRFSGAGILSYEAGFNSPFLTLQEAQGKQLPSFSSLDIHYDLYMTRYWQEAFRQL